MRNDPIRIAVTGAAGRVSYALIFRIASGEMFGPDQPVCLHLIELPEKQEILKGVIMELEDCAFSLLHNIVATHRLDEGFSNVHWVFLVGSSPQKEDMSRDEYIATNAKIFYEQGRYIQDYASFDVRIVVIGNPCNTNCWAAMQNAKDIPPNRWFALTHLDENRARVRLAEKAGVPLADVQNLGIWGNHSENQFPDFFNARIRGRPAVDVIGDLKWLENDFIRMAQQHREEIIKIRKHSPSASAASAIIDTVNFFIDPHPSEHWFSLGVHSDGSYEIEKGLVCSFPIWRVGINWEIVPNIRMNDFSRNKIKASVDELIQERNIAQKAIGNGNGSRSSKKNGKKSRK